MVVYRYGVPRRAPGATWARQQKGERILDLKATPTEEDGRIQLKPEPASARAARRFVRRHLRCLGVPADAVQTAVLVSSEFVTNAYLHGHGKIELRVRVRGDHVRIEVIDEGRDQEPAVRERDLDEPGGWGLLIVDQLALRWGVFEGTTHVWADLAVS